MKKRVHEMELNRSSVQMVLAERFPGYSRASDFNSVISDPQDIMVRGNEESFMEHGFGVAGLNGCRSIMCAITGPPVIAEMFLTETENGLAESAPADRVWSKTY